MADQTKIEWADATVNAVNGCSVLSPGCTNCYAMRLAGTRLREHPSRAGLTQPTKAGPVWTGEVRLNEQQLLQPLRWRRPRRIFWNAHGDLFHGAVPDEWIDRVFAVCELTPQHTHMILTKRSERMFAYLTRRKAEKPVLVPVGDGTLEQHPFNSELKPPKNIWLGVSVEDQPRADDRIADLRDTPAAVRFVSFEPLLGAVQADLTGIHWAIVGGESGPGARPMHPDWARSLRDQCQAAGVAFFFKQFGDWVPYNTQPGDDLGADVGAGRVQIVNPSGRDIYEQSELTGRGGEPGCRYMRRVGKRAAGRLLDGREHSEFPA